MRQNLEGSQRKKKYEILRNKNKISGQKLFKTKYNESDERKTI